MARPQVKLYTYFVPQIPNFGDRLNDWLWPQVLPQVAVNAPLSETAPELVLFGIGTVLHDFFADGWEKVVLGAGVGYTGLPNPDRNWKFYAVRGPVSAGALGLSKEVAISDPAILVNRYYQHPDPFAQERFPCSLMVHHHNADFNAPYWEQVCSDLGIQFINPYWPVEKILSIIARSDLVISEALHGAIVADAFRIPWIPIISTQTILPLKWVDWTLAHQIKVFQPQVLGMPQSPRHVMNCARTPKIPQRPDPTLATRMAMIRDDLDWIQTHSRRHLSEDAVFERCLVRFEEKVDLFREDYC